MRTVLAVLTAVLVADAARAQPALSERSGPAGPAGVQTIRCDLSEYKSAPGLAAVTSRDGLTVTWDGDRGHEVRLALAVNDGAPLIRELAVRRKGGTWATVVTGATPYFHVVSGMRRVTEQQLQPLRQLKIELTPALVDRVKWDAFWDAPLNLDEVKDTREGAIPPPKGIAGQPGLPRRAEEVHRGDATFNVQGCKVKTDGARLIVMFPGAQVGVFTTGTLQYTVFKGTNLVEQRLVAKTDAPSVAYKYDAGLKGLAIQPASRIVWRDTAGAWQDYQFGSAVNSGPATLRAANRLVIAESAAGSVVAFPPPHTFFWSREVSFNLGYNWYRKDTPASYSFGVRQPEFEFHPEDMGRGEEDTRQNFALRSARPGTWQQMPVYLYVSAESAAGAAQGALAFTRGDRFKAVPGYQVMGTHFHSSLVGRARRQGGLDTKVAEVELMKAAGINIFAPIDGSSLGFGLGRADRLATLAEYYDVARRHSDRTFLIMPNEEVTGGASALGGHNDLLISKPVYWTNGRAAGQPFVENDPKYGKVYHVGSAADMMALTEQENMLLYMPHPNSKGSTGYPEAIKHTDHFRHGNYRGFGVRWGMGIDGSETRLCEIRCQTLWDEANNWMSAAAAPLKFIQAITETYQQGPGDDIYANGPVNYVKVNALPGPDDWSPIVNAMRAGDYFWTSGEVLIPSFKVEGSGATRTISASVEWTFPLDFVEVVWGDGTKVDRQIVSTTDQAAFGQKQFTIPFDARGKKWVRFAAWDVAGNGAMAQPVRMIQ
jgi:hypothetical protein